MNIAEAFPVTKDLGLIDASVDSVATTVVRWSATFGQRRKSRRVDSLEDALKSMEPLSADMRRMAIVPTQAGWSAVFQSGINGSDPGSLMPVLAGRLRTSAMRVCSSPPSVKYPATIWENYLGTATPENETVAPHGRTICAANDGGRWRFLSSGAPYDFENIENYLKPRVGDRFTRELLATYLARFSLYPFDDAFYDVTSARPAIIVETVRRWREPRFPEFSYAEVLAGLPWSR